MTFLSGAETHGSNLTRSSLTVQGNLLDEFLTAYDAADRPTAPRTKGVDQR